MTLTLSAVSGAAAAQGNETNATDFDAEGAGELKEAAGITPDSSFYFIDRFFDMFASDLETREEKIAEVKEMLEAGDYESARAALEKYKIHADEVEFEVSPEESEEAERSARAIRGAIKDVAHEIPAGEKDEFVRLIVKKEKDIETAAAIATRVKELCEELAELDPDAYYDVCSTGDEDAPKWKRELDKDLTAEQKEEAKKFASVMKECFKSSGETCRCDEIPYAKFAASCSEAAPLATACDIGGNEEACEKLDNLDMPELPPHLQDIFDELEGGIKEEKFDLHMPSECVDAGAKTPKECGNVMTMLHAPKECKAALLAAEPASEKEGREICDKIMMEKHSPECVDEGISDPEKCKDFMWNVDERPEICQSHDIHDFRDCKRFLEEGGETKKMGPGFGGGDCREMSDPMERLACYDGLSSGVEEYKEGEESKDYAKCDDCESKCPGASSTNCVDDRCKCYYDDHDDDWDNDEGSGGGGDDDWEDDSGDGETGGDDSEGGDDSGADGGESEGGEDDGDTDGEEDSGSDDGGDMESEDSGSDDGSDSGTSDGGGDSGSSDGGSSDGGGEGVTGDTVYTGNPFLDYLLG